MEEELIINQEINTHTMQAKHFYYQVTDILEIKGFLLNFFNKLNTCSKIVNPRAIIFFNEKSRLDNLYAEMKKDNSFNYIIEQLIAIHGDQPSEERIENKKKFNNHQYRFLMTTSIVARGINFNDISVIINCDVPTYFKMRHPRSPSPIKAEEIDVATYLHRITRQANPHNKKSVSITFSQLAGEENIIELALKNNVILHSNESIQQIINYLDEDQQQQLSSLFSERSWKDLGISKEVEIQLISNKFETPTIAQEASIPQILNNNHNNNKLDHISIFGYQSGIGKTLCYLIPMIQDYVSQQKMTDTWSPQVVILAHTKDLCLQIGNLLTQIMPLSKKYEISYFFRDSETKDTKGSICIATPGYFMKVLNKITTNNLKYLILDEADEVIYNNTTDLNFLMQAMNKSDWKNLQFLLFSSTFQERDYEYLSYIFDNSAFFQEDIEIKFISENNQIILSPQQQH